MTQKIQLYEAFADSLGIPVEDISDDLAYNSIPKWDSTAHMALIDALENIFDVLLETDDIIDMSSVRKAKEILHKHGIDV